VDDDDGGHAGAGYGLDELVAAVPRV
jgi:hypothetical protein